MNKKYMKLIVILLFLILVVLPATFSLSEFVKNIKKGNISDKEQLEEVKSQITPWWKPILDNLGPVFVVSIFVFFSWLKLEDLL